MRISRFVHRAIRSLGFPTAIVLIVCAGLPFPEPLPIITGSAHASSIHTTLLESAFVYQDSAGAAVMGLTCGGCTNYGGSYRGQTINHGIQFQDCPATAEFRLNAQYDRLDVTFYNEHTDQGAVLTISDNSDPSNPRVLLVRSIDAIGQAQVGFSVSHIQFITIKSASGDTGCSNRIDIQGTLTTGLPKMTQVVPRYPTGNAGVSAESKVLFAWQPFPGATNYAFQVWLVELSGSTSLLPGTPFSFAASIYHKTSYTWNDHGFAAGAYKYSLLPLNDSGHNLAGWSTPIQFTISS